MQVKKIKQIDKDLYEVLIDDYILLVSSEVVIKYNLLSKKAISNEKFLLIKKNNEYYQELNRVLQFIGKKMRSIFETKDFMKKNNFSFGNKILEYLINQYWLDDKKFAFAYVHDKINLSNYGPNKIIDDLKKHQINDEIIKNVFAEIDDQVFWEKLRKIVVKKLKQNKKYSQLVITKNILNYCLNLGYCREDIIILIEKNYCFDDKIIKEAKQKFLRKHLNKYDKLELRKQLQNHLIQKGFTIDQIKKVID